MNKTRFRLLVVAFLAAVVCLPARPLTELTWPDCQNYLKTRTFVSKEELLQLFYDITLADSLDDFVMEKTTIRALHKELHTLFPLEHCQRIVFSQNRLTILFDKPQVVSVPGMWMQVSLCMPDTLVFEVSRLVKEPQTLRFNVNRGYVNVRTSGLAKMLSDFAIDVYGTALLYNIDYAGKNSDIGLEEIDFVEPGSFSLQKNDSSVVLLASHPRLAHDSTLSFQAGQVHYFGITATLSGTDTVRYSHGRTDSDSTSNRAFRAIIDTVLRNPSAVFRNGVSKVVTVHYNLEKEKGSFYQGFVFGPAER